MNQASTQIGHLLLENGISFFGTSVGANQTKNGDTHVFAEVVFNTSMSGYQEILTDPSYLHQIVTFTYPEIGNYGVHPMHQESSTIKVSGMLARKMHRYNYANITSAQSASNKNSNPSPNSLGTPTVPPTAYNDGEEIPSHTCLADYLKEQGIIALEGVDTRKLTRILRSVGVMRGILSSSELSKSEGEKLLKQLPNFESINMPQQVTCKLPYKFFSKNTESTKNSSSRERTSKESTIPKIGVVDYGTKYNILRILESHGMHVQVYPCTTSAETLLSENLSGILLSNGPGNPAACTTEVAEIKKLLGKLPIFGICLGHQLLALALGGETSKLTFGHRGANHPIQSRDSSKIDISSQNHGYEVVLKGHEEKTSSEQKQAEAATAENPNQKAKIAFLKSETLSHINLNDFTVAGYRNKTSNSFAVQYHPEGAPGPHDSHYLFSNFCEMVRRFKKTNILETKL